MFNTTSTLIWKVCAIISIGFAARNIEAFQLKFEDVLKVADENGKIYFKIEHCRTKQKGAKEKNDHIITGDIEVRCIDTYINSFPVSTRVGCFWRRIYVENGAFIGSEKSNIGKNSFAKISIEIAVALELPYPNSYTSHSFRRSAATWAADEGATTMQLKSLTGNLILPVLIFILFKILQMIY
jgi:hypothetical protein